MNASSRLALLLVGALLGAIFAIAPAAFADGDPRTDDVPRLIPYQGQLELDGRPVDASGDDALHLLFALYDGVGAAEPVYTQQIVVEVYNGRFTANIGPFGQGPDGRARAIADIIAAADDLSLGITLLGDPDDPGDDIALNNRQRIHATPYSMWSTTATNLVVAGRADVGGDLRIDGDALIGGALRVDGALDIAPGALANGTVEAVDIAPAALGDGLVRRGSALGVDPDFLDDRIRTWVRSHCQVQLGWRDSCNNCGLLPSKFASALANATCGAAAGANTGCRGGSWAGVNTDGGVGDDDVFYIRMECD